jgi:hypothetical protein
LGGGGGSAAGGGVYVVSGTANVTNASLLNNTAEGGPGGSGSQAYAGGTGGTAGGGGLVSVTSATISGTILMSNVAQAGQGGAGGMGCSGNTTPLAGFGGSGGFAFGGGLQFGGTTGVVSNDMVDGNQAVAGLGGSGSTPGYGGRAFGGGLYLQPNTAQSTTVTLSDTTIESNAAPNSPGNPYGGEGGGIYVQDATVTLCNDTVEFNTATRGGGIYTIESEPGPAVSIDPSTVVTNNTDSSGTNGSTANIDGAYILQKC